MKVNTIIFYVLILGLLASLGCSVTPTEFGRGGIKYAQYRCKAISCFTRFLYTPKEIIETEQGTTVIWFSKIGRKVSKRRPVTNGVYWEIIDEPCTYTAVFDTDGMFLKSWGEGPGCFE